LIVDRGCSLPVVDSVALVGASTAVHDITWEASSKPVFYDIWLSK
jgi:peptide/nickel transport system substrate-binding protein